MQTKSINQMISPCIGKITHDPEKSKNIPDINQFFVETKITDPIRCIDGRPATELTANLGPQLTGCSSIVALLYRVAIGLTEDQSNLTEDTAKIISLLKDSGLGFGAHDDSHHSSDSENTGCGALDNMPKVIQSIQDKNSHHFIKTILKQINISEANTAIALNKIADIDFSNYLEYSNEDHRYKCKQRSFLATKNESPQTIETLTGPHQEQLTILNYIPDTTFDRNRFCQTTNNQLSCFNYDIWHVANISKALFNKIGKQELFKTLHYIYTVATIFILTDGSLPIVIRK